MPNDKFVVFVFLVILIYFDLILLFFLDYWYKGNENNNVKYCFLDFFLKKYYFKNQSERERTSLTNAVKGLLLFRFHFDDQNFSIVFCLDGCGY